MRHTFFNNNTGAQVAEQDALDERGCIRDGISMRTKIGLMDGVSTFDAPLVLTDEQKHAAREARKAALSDAWRNPVDQFAAPTVDAAAAAQGGDYYERRDRRLQEAWRS
jgi:hypothetical protein